MRAEVILASKSPSRAQILANAGVEAEICGADIDERIIEAAFAADYAIKQAAAEAAGKSADNAAYAPLLAQRLAQAKAEAVSARFADAYIIGCDQILEVEGQILHKTANEEEAFQRLTDLAGKTHKLHSAFSLIRNGARLSSYVDTAAMRMRTLSAKNIHDYLDRTDRSVLQSLGVYQIEGQGIRLFDTIEGDYWTIIGLPLLPLLNALRALNIID